MGAVPWGSVHLGSGGVCPDVIRSVNWRRRGPQAPPPIPSSQRSKGPCPLLRARHFQEGLLPLISLPSAPMKGPLKGLFVAGLRVGSPPPFSLPLIGDVHRPNPTSRVPHPAIDLWD